METTINHRRISAPISTGASLDSEVNTNAKPKPGKKQPPKLSELNGLILKEKQKARYIKIKIKKLKEKRQRLKTMQKADNLKAKALLKTKQKADKLKSQLKGWKVPIAELNNQKLVLDQPAPPTLPTPPSEPLPAHQSALTPPSEPVEPVGASTIAPQAYNSQDYIVNEMTYQQRTQIHQILFSIKKAKNKIVSANEYIKNKKETIALIDEILADETDQQRIDDYNNRIALQQSEIADKEREIIDLECKITAYIGKLEQTKQSYQRTNASTPPVQ
jgi:hypothetical protein